MRLRSLLLATALVAPLLATEALAATPTPAPAASDSAAPLAPHAPDTVLVGFDPSASGLDRAAARRSVNAVAAEQVSPLAHDVEKMTLPKGLSVETAMAVLSRARGVRYAEPDYVVTKAATSNDPSYLNGGLWGMYGDASSPANQFGSQAAEAWTNGVTGSSAIAIGVIDEGIDVSHPDLAGNIWVNPTESAGRAGIDDDGNGYVDDINGYDFANNDASVYDGGTADKHGTHVSGTIGAVGGNGVGVVGVNWDVTIVSGKFLGPNGGYTSDATRAVDYMTDLKVRHGLNIVATSNSWGGGGYSSTLAAAINRAGDRNILFVAAAGNDASDNDTLASYPSNTQCTTNRTFDCVVAVASITNTGGLSSFSNFGATTVDIGAPGSSILSTLPGNTYGTYSGTSMATPHVSGAIALCAAANPSLTAGQLRSFLMTSVQSTTSLAGRVVNSGRLDVGSMLVACAASAGPLSGSAPSNLTATANGATSVRLAWTDGVTNEVTWTVQRAVSSSGTCGTYTSVGTAGANATSFVDSGLAGATTYCYRVQANGSSSNTAWSNVATATTDTPPPPYVCSAVGYSWYDPTVGGTLRVLADDAAVLVTLPFTVSWFGVDHTTASVASNGYLRFGSGAATSFTNAAIPNVAEPNNMAAAWHDDLNPSTGGSVYTTVQGAAPNRRFIASWVDINPFGTTGNPITFQIVVNEADDTVTFQYRDVDAATSVTRGASATVGVENADGSAGTQVSYNSASLTNSSAIRCSNVPVVAQPVSVTTASLPGGTVGTAYSQTLTATGGTGAYTWSSTGTLPPGITLSGAGVLSGNPTTAGTYSFTATATDGANSKGSQNLSITVAPAPVTVTTASLAGGTVGTAYSQTLAATGGTGTYTWSSTGTLPGGITLSGAGVLSGNPTASGTFTFTVIATDGASATGTKQLSITVAPAPAPGAFGKTSPTNGATNRKTPLTLSWGAATGATSYEYCLTTTAPTTSTITCASTAGWVSTGANRSVVLSSLTRRTVYYWQVRAVNANGTTYANVVTGGSTWWRFTSA